MPGVEGDAPDTSRYRFQYIKFPTSRKPVKHLEGIALGTSGKSGAPDLVCTWHPKNGGAEFHWYRLPEDDAGLAKKINHSQVTLTPDAIELGDSLNGFMRPWSNLPAYKKASFWAILYTRIVTDYRSITLWRWPDCAWKCDDPGSMPIDYTPDELDAVFQAMPNAMNSSSTAPDSGDDGSAEDAVVEETVRDVEGEENAVAREEAGQQPAEDAESAEAAVVEGTSRVIEWDRGAGRQRTTVL
ncbi:hypothetical protein AC578_619 [Pseudocercospora eumusae]|uniref:Uncharacterized protein n=1 Tax=Pseudocercospora eumusae TaxID=321146 RepID=A0A139HFD7_9PEZI|nr:hypothetical protein AC578_619 [Pseudocercospora eumusae]